MPGEVDRYLKGRFCPKPPQGRNAKELRRGTTCFTSEPTEDSVPKYADWEACASLFVAIDILTNNGGIHHFEFEGEPAETARGLLVLVPCALQYVHKSGATEHNTYPSTIEDLTDNFSFSEIYKQTMQIRLCYILCKTVSDKDALLNYGGLILPFGEMTLFLIFSPTTDDTSRTSLPKEIRPALRSHKALFC